MFHTHVYVVKLQQNAIFGNDYNAVFEKTTVGCDVQFLPFHYAVISNGYIFIKE